MFNARSLVRDAINVIPSTHNRFFSHAKLSDNRKEEIVLRRDKLKILQDDLPEIKIVINELLSYMPSLVTLDDRYLQLEKILDAIDNVRESRNSATLVSVCSDVYNELVEKPGHLKNLLLDCLATIQAKLATTHSIPQAKL
mgnify:CR=1 FL=1